MKDFRDVSRRKLVIGKTDRSAKNIFLSAKAREGARRTPFFHEGPLRTAKNTFLSAKAREGARRTSFYPRRATKGREERFFIREGPRRTPFDPRRGAENGRALVV